MSGSGQGIPPDDCVVDELEWPRTSEDNYGPILSRGSPFIVAGVVYYFSTALGPAFGLSITAALVVLTDGRVGDVGRGMGAEFKALEHLQRWGRHEDDKV